MDSKELILHTYAEDAYLGYAVSTVKERALAQVEDGQKPVQRRILFAMQQLGLSSTGKPVKSARVVGDVLGKYHPHGDQSVYDAMVRMAQKFTLRYPLVLGQGNFGSRDGDGAAAMRYTEARLSPIAEALLLRELGVGTTDFVSNYDGKLKEPTLLPARLPLLLLNGTMGIAVGMASDVPPHNLREVAAAGKAAVMTPDCSDDDILEHLKGPDFPGGGQLISSRQEVLSAYRAGRGSLRCRARWEREDLARGQWQIVVKELPYQVSTREIMEQVDTLTNPQPPSGKKALSQQQVNLKQLSLEFLEKIVDESDKDSEIRLVISPKSSKVDADQMMAFLLANTSLESTVSLNGTSIGLDGKPQTKSIPKMVREWAIFRVKTVRRRTEHELDVALKRIHILQGRLTVFLNLEQVIKTIREAEDPSKELQSLFALSEVQADDILEMRLRQLNKLEGLKIEKDLNDLEKLASSLRSLLADEKRLRALVGKEIEEDSDKLGDDRRTLVKEEARVVPSSAAVRNVVDEPVTLVLSKNLWVKAYKGQGLPPTEFSFKAGDGLLMSVETRTVEQVVVLDSKGRAYSFDASLAPQGRGEGVPLSTLIDLQGGASVMTMLSGSPSDEYLFCGQQGYGFIAPLSALYAKPRAGKAFLTLSPDELPMSPVRVSSDKDVVMCGTEEGKVLAFPAAEVKRLEKGKGVMLMVVDDTKLSAISVLEELPPHFLGKTPATGKELRVSLSSEDHQKILGHRARKGVWAPKKVVFLGEA